MMISLKIIVLNFSKIYRGNISIRFWRANFGIFSFSSKFLVPNKTISDATISFTFIVLDKCC